MTFGLGQRILLATQCWMEGQLDQGRADRETPELGTRLSQQDRVVVVKDKELFQEGRDLVEEGRDLVEEGRPLQSLGGCLVGQELVDGHKELVGKGMKRSSQLWMSVSLPFVFFCCQSCKQLQSPLQHRCSRQLQ